MFEFPRSGPHASCLRLLGIVLVFASTIRFLDPPHRLMFSTLLPLGMLVFLLSMLTRRASVKDKQSKQCGIGLCAVK